MPTVSNLRRRGASIGGLLARTDGYNSGTGAWATNNYYHADGNGNITYLENSSQGLAASYRYDPFGNTISSSGTLAYANTYRFSSKECHTNSGMYYYRYRFYDPNLQRWINRDPIQQQGGRMNKKMVKLQAKAGWNLYELALNSPLHFIDTDGRGIKHTASEILRHVGIGGQCCNKSGSPQWWLNNREWNLLPVGACTGFTDDCDGLMCNGAFYEVTGTDTAQCNKDCPATTIPRPPVPVMPSEPGPSYYPGPPVSQPLGPGWTPGTLGRSPRDKYVFVMPPGYAPPM